MHSETLQPLMLFLVLGLIALNALAYYSKKSMILPNIIWVLILGLVYGGVSFSLPEHLPQLHIDPGVVLFVFVPLLIFASTQKICLFHFRTVLPQASLIATLGIVISTLIIAIPFFYIFNIGWLESLLFGVVVSATDPLAVGALLHGDNNIDESQKLLIEGESILNDGFVVTVYGIITVLLFSNSDFDALHSSYEFIIHIIGSVLLGVFLGRLARWLLDKWHEEHFILTVNMTLALAYGSFSLGETLGLSGILTVFSSALAFGYKPKVKGHNKDFHNHVWEYLEYITNTVVFFMLGASFFQYFSLQSISFAIIITSLILLILSRLGGLALLYPMINIDGKPLSRKEFWLLNFSGARGAVSIALMLLLPTEFTLKPMFMSLTLIIIFVSLIIYPLLARKAIS
ncbi:sodium:proton antiporter [Vibrio tasmaniensis]|nr:sodium:proton antiporter [Vibrio tasmaniensis]